MLFVLAMLASVRIDLCTLTHSRTTTTTIARPLCHYNCKTRERMPNAQPCPIGVTIFVVVSLFSVFTIQKVID